MKRVMVVALAVMMSVSPAFAWYDGYGNWNNTYLDPLTSFLDGIFGPPIPVQYYVPPPPPVVVIRPPTIVIKPAPPVVIEKPVPYPVPVPVDPTVCTTYDNFGNLVYKGPC